MKDGKKIYKHSLSTFEFTEIDTVIDISNGRLVLKSLNNHYLVTTTGNIYSLDIYTNKIDIVYSNLTEKKLLSAYALDNIIIMPFVDEKVTILNTLDNSIIMVDFPNDFKKRFEQELGGFSWVTESDEYIYFVGSVNYILSVSKKDKNAPSS